MKILAFIYLMYCEILLKNAREAMKFMMLSKREYADPRPFNASPSIKLFLCSIVNFYTNCFFRITITVLLTTRFLHQYSFSKPDFRNKLSHTNFCLSISLPPAHII
jgi:hypothetical protein